MKSVGRWTPGPWEVNGQGKFIDVGGPGFLAAQSRSCYRNDGGMIASVMPFGHHRYDWAMAHAHLIAAAPTMAEYIAKRAELGDDEALQIWAALKKALGEAEPSTQIVQQKESEREE